MSDVVIGDRELIQALRRLGEKAGDVLEKATLAGAAMIAEPAEENAPRRTGFLGEHIVSEVLEKSAEHVEVGVGPSKEAFWGLFQEMGTVQHPAQPFLRPAFDGNKGRVEREIQETVARAIESETS